MPETLERRYPETEDSVEEESYSSRVLLHFERHGDKAGEDLSDQGKKTLFDKGRRRPTVAPTAVAMGGNLTRATHSAALDMAGAMQTDEFTGEESLDELREKLDKDLKVGSKIGTDIRLGFYYDTEQLKQAATQAIKEGNFLAWMVKDSDRLAREYGDTGLSYSHAAADVASILKKYTTIAGRFDKLAQDQEKNYGKVLERFLGTHNAITESLISKVLEKNQGAAARDAFVESLKAGFKTGEGCEVMIDTLPDRTEPRVRIKFSRENEDGEKIIDIDEAVPSEVLDEIISERM